MKSTSNVSIRLQVFGDVVLDQLINCLENKLSPAFIYLLSVPANTSVAVFDPFVNVGPIWSDYNVTGVLIIPPHDGSGVPYSLSAQDPPPPIYFHPTNPMFITLISLGAPLYIHHLGPNTVTFQIMWV